MNSHHHLIHTALVGCFTWTVSSQELLLSKRISWHDIFSITTTLTFSNLELSVIFPTSPLLNFFTFIHYRVTLYDEWLRYLALSDISIKKSCIKWLISVYSSTKLICLNYCHFIKYIFALIVYENYTIQVMTY